MAFKVSGIRNLVTVTLCKQTANSNVQPHRLRANGHGLNVGVIHQQRDVPTPASVQFDGNSRRLTFLWKWAAPTNRQCFYTQRLQTLAHFSTLIAERVNSALPPLCFFLKLGYFARPVKKLLNALQQVPQSLLQRYAAYLIQKLQVFLLFPRS